MTEFFPKGYALIVGVGADLPNTIDDARGISDILQDAERCAYLPEHVNLLTGEEAKRDNVLNALDQLVQKTDIESTVVVYFSGHGYCISSPIGEFYYLMPYGYNTSKLSTTAINGAEFTQKLKAIPAKKLVVLLDCCHAGGVGEAKAPGVEFSKSPLPPEALSLLEEGGGQVLISSSTEDELSYVGKPYSAFTLAIIEAFCGSGVSKKDGYVRVADLALHARQVVPGRTSDKQHPVLHFEHADNFVLAYYAGGSTEPKGLPFAIEPTIEPEPGVWTKIDQRDQMVQGPQTNIAGDSHGPVLSGEFQGPVQIGDTKVEGGFHQPNWNVNGDVIQTQGDIIHDESITVGEVKDSIGVSIGHGVQSTTTVTQQSGLSGDEIAQAFEPIIQVIEKLPDGTDKNKAREALEKLEDEARKADQADESRVRKWLNFLAETSPDAWEVAIDTFIHPIKGISTIFQKIAAHVKENRDKQ